MITTVGIMSSNRLDNDTVNYLNYISESSSTVKDGVNYYLRLLKLNRFGGFRSLLLFHGSTEDFRRLNVFSLDPTTNASVRATFSGSYNFNDSTTGVSLTGGRFFFNTVSGGNTFNSNEGGYSPPEDSAFQMMCAKNTPGFLAFQFGYSVTTLTTLNTGSSAGSPNTQMDMRVYITGSNLAIGYNPCFFSSWYDFTVPTSSYSGITILNGNSTTNQQVLMHNKQVVQTNYIQDSTGVVYYPYGMPYSTTLNVNMYAIANARYTIPQLELLTDLTNAYLQSIGRL